MYIRTRGHLGQFKWRRAQWAKFHDRSCLWDSQDLIPDWEVFNRMIIKQTLDDFEGRESELRTKHKVWIKNEFVHRIVLSWRTSKPIYKQLVPQIVQRFQTSKPIRTIILIGHTDEPGTPTFNYNLGLKRAKAVCHRIIRIKDWLTRSTLRYFHLEIALRSKRAANPVGLIAESMRMPQIVNCRHNIIPRSANYLDC